MQNRELNKIVGDQPITEDFEQPVLWKVHYKNEDGSVSWIHTFCKTQKQAEELFLEDTLGWIGNTKYYFLYAEVVGELILPEVLRDLV